MARAPRRQFGRRVPAHTGWVGVSTAPATLAAATKVLVATFVPTGGGPGETVLRVRGNLMIDGGGAADGALGACVVTDSAVTAGIASIPDPVTEIDDDIWSMVVPWGVGGAADPDFQNIAFDSKGMRKVDDGQAFSIVMVNGGATIITFQVYLRILSKTR